MQGHLRDTGAKPEAEQDGAEQRAQLRTGMLMTAGLRIGGGEERQVRIRNLSERGLMAEPGEHIASGTAITISLPGVGEVDGTVAWSTEGRIGVALSRPIDIALVNAARSAG
ncbi:hypothetical protein GCM10011380_23300 [Sphingomonas metalli]|uniref:PilZ domain-containing protein n=1 Tax=Sphingomonas metalli TaxID=1779358 RepID=A0A916T7I2_9SPHN|nr:PilZ domain-containing protein [Sphingomonas metalli]GGB33172.1 hypothetical protein GCM10011380_23300 [Sphingomonas metalli]